MPPVEDQDLRSTIESAVSTAEGGGPLEGGVAAPSPSPQGGTPTPGTVSPGYVAPTPAPTPGAPATPPAGPVPTPVGSIPPKEGVVPPSGVPAAPPTGGTAPEDKPPGTWTPQARERWKEVHPDVRAEVIRRERETSRAMTQSTNARKFQQEFMEAIRPFEGFIAAEKSTPIKAAVNMMQTAALLRTGTIQQKAQLVAQVISQYGVDLQMLDGILAGQQPQGNGPGQAEEFIQRAVRAATEPLLARIQARDAEFDQQLDSEVSTDLAAFIADPKHEFYEDVKEIMADLMEVDHKRGGNMDLTRAYASATLLSEPVRLTLEGRKTGQSAQRGHQIAQQARSGAFSVKPSDETGVTTLTPGDSIRDAILYSLEKTSGR